MSQLGQDLPTTASLEILLINIPGGAIAFAYLWSLKDNNFEKFLSTTTKPTPRVIFKIPASVGRMRSKGRSM